MSEGLETSEWVRLRKDNVRAHVWQRSAKHAPAPGVKTLSAGPSGDHARARTLAMQRPAALVGFMWHKGRTAWLYGSRPRRQMRGTWASSNDGHGKCFSAPDT